MFSEEPKYSDWNTYKQLLEWAKLPTLLNRRLQDIATIMYRVKSKICPKYMVDMFSRNSTVYNLRVKEFCIPRFNTVNYGKHSLRYFGPLLWSKLPANIRTIQSLKLFKREIRNLDLETLMASDDCRTAQYVVHIVNILAVGIYLPRN